MKSKFFKKIFESVGIECGCRVEKKKVVKGKGKGKKKCGRRKKFAKKDMKKEE
ncbi:hypothetical protein KY336_03460 [Candidatus Woesearchaeota archaeon]|nr:hypothetical protein [Candidatus Woesearchaeota archaeon]